MCYDNLHFNVDPCSCNLLHMDLLLWDYQGVMGREIQVFVISSQGIHYDIALLGGDREGQI